MGKLLGGGSNKQSSNTTNEPWAPAQDALKKILENANNLFDKQGGINAEWINKEIADLTPEMQETVKGLLESKGMKDMINSMSPSVKEGVSGIGQASGILGRLAEGEGDISGKNINDLAKELYQSDRVQSQVDQMTKNVQQGLAKENQALDQAASASGNMGSSRAGVAQGVAQGKAADAIATGSANIQNAAMQDAMGQAYATLSGNRETKANAASGLGNLGIGSGNLGMGLIGQENNILENALKGASITQGQAQNVANNNWFNAQGTQNAGWDQLSKILGIAGSIGGMGGTSQGTQSGGGGGMAGLGGLMGGLGAMGSAFGWSDASMKTKVKRKKKGENGEAAEYSWEWNKSAEKRVGKKGRDKGVLAQQEAKDNPSAVAKDKKTGRLMVDYDKV